MLEFLFGMMGDGKLKEPANDKVPLADFKTALSVVTSGTGKKQILLLSDNTQI